MPTLELVLPEKLLFVFSNISLISFCFFISFIFARLFKNFIIFFIVLAILSSTFYGDIFLKHIVRTYYILFKKDSQILIKASKNLNGKIDSLDIKDIYTYNLVNSSMLSIKDRYTILKTHEKYVDKFIDISTKSIRFNRSVFDHERVYLNKNSNLSNEKARYEVNKKLGNNLFKTLYDKEEYLFRDNINNITIASAWKITFKPSHDKFRNKHLFWSLDKEMEFNPKPIQNFDTIYKKLFMN